MVPRVEPYLVDELLSRGIGLIRSAKVPEEDYPPPQSVDHKIWGECDLDPQGDHVVKEFESSFVAAEPSQDRRSSRAGKPRGATRRRQRPQHRICLCETIGCLLQTTEPSERIANVQQRRP